MNWYEDSYWEEPPTEGKDNKFASILDISKLDKVARHDMAKKIGECNDRRSADFMRTYFSSPGDQSKYRLDIMGLDDI